MSTQLHMDLKSTAPTGVIRNAMNPFGVKDLTALAGALSPVGPSVHEALMATAPHYRPEFRKDLAEYVGAAPFAIDGIDAGIATEHFSPPASALKAAGLTSRTAPWRKPRTSEGWQDDLASGEGLTVALRRTPDRSETASRARRSRPAHLRTTDAKLAHSEPNPGSSADSLLTSHTQILTQRTEVAWFPFMFMRILA